jgi:hypothetical protein
MREWRYLTVGCVIGSFVAFLAAGERSLAAPTPGQATGNTEAKVATTQSAKVAERAWWNQAEVIKALQLKDEQRKKMDTLLTQMFDAQRAIQVTQVEAQKTLEEALAKGDWEAARKTAGKLRDGMANVWGVQSNLKIDALAVLDATQRQTLVKQFHQVLQQPTVLWAPKMEPQTAPPPAAQK